LFILTSKLQTLDIKTKISCIIIDDEGPCIETLKWDLNQYCSEVTVIATCRNGQEALSVIAHQAPDLIFLDVEMPEMNGFEMLERIDTPNFHVIFTTAYDHYALKAFKVSAIDYLLKPIDKDELIKAVHKVKKQLYRQKSTESISENINNQVKNLLQNIDSSNRGKTVALPTLEGYDIIDIDNIVNCQSESNYTYIYLSDNRQIVISKTLKEVEAMLPSEVFLRVHHSHIVNTKYILKYIKGQGGELILRNQRNIPVSRSKKELVTDWIKNMPSPNS